VTKYRNQHGTAWPLTRKTHDHTRRHARRGLEADLD